MAIRHSASTLVLAFLCIGPAAALTTFRGIRQTDGVVNAAMLALLQHDKPTTDDLEQVAGQLAQLAAAKINGGQMGVNATAIADAISQLVSTIKTEAQNAVSETQGILNGLHSAIGQCDPPSNSQALISSLVGNQTSRSTAHTTCKSNLQMMDTNLATCNSLVTSLEAQRDGACQLVLDGSLAPTPDGQVCNQNTHETYKDWVTRLAGFFDTAKTEYLDREETCISLRDYVTGNASHCSSLQTGLNNKQAQCDIARTSLNSAGCALANTQASVCHNYNCCYSDTTQAYAVARTNAEQEQIAFVAQWKALDHIECLLVVMVQPDVNTEKINNCLTKSVSTTPVELSFQNVPDKLPCTLPTVYPCMPEWEQQHQIGDTCVPCQGIEDSTSCGSGGSQAPALYEEGKYCCPSSGCSGTPNDGGPWDRFWTERPNSGEECGEIVKAKYPNAVYFMWNKKPSSIHKMCQVLIHGNDNCDVMGTHASFTIYKFAPASPANSPPAGTQWIMSGKGESCDAACGTVGKVCNSEKPSSLTTNTLVAEGFTKAGYTCKSFHGARNTPGAPFSTGRDGDDCAPIIDPATYTCSNNRNAGHNALCACEEATTTAPTPGVDYRYQKNCDLYNPSWEKIDHGITDICGCIDLCAATPNCVGWEIAGGCHIARHFGDHRGGAYTYHGRHCGGPNVLPNPPGTLTTLTCTR